MQIETEEKIERKYVTIKIEYKLAFLFWTVGINNITIVGKSYCNRINISHEYLKVDFSSSLSFLRKAPPKLASTRSLAAARAELDPTPE